jgi:polyribonucleotide nucleotidyltransferase
MMKPEGKTFQVEVGGKTLTFETGRLAGQAGGAMTVQLGDSQLFGVATMDSQPREGIDFFPLSVKNACMPVDVSPVLFSAAKDVQPKRLS